MGNERSLCEELTVTHVQCNVKRCQGPPRPSLVCLFMANDLLFTCCSMIRFQKRAWILLGVFLGGGRLLAGGGGEAFWVGCKRQHQTPVCTWHSNGARWHVCSSVCGRLFVLFFPYSVVLFLRDFRALFSSAYLFSCACFFFFFSFFIVLYGLC